METEHLVKQCKKGNPRAEYQLYKTYVNAMYNVAYRIAGNKFDAEDALQEAFVKAFKKIRSFKGESTFGVWLKRIVVNQCLSNLRKKNIFADDIDTVIEESDEDQDYTELPIDIKKVMEAINELPDGARAVFTLKAIEQYKFKEIAEMLDQTEGNCKVQYHRSKQLLRDKLSRELLLNN